MTLGYPRNDMVWGFKVSQVRVKTTAIRRGFELYECFPVTTIQYRPNHSVKRLGVK